MMNPSIAEEGGQTARTVIGAMQSQPLAIALILINIMFLGGVGYLITDIAHTIGLRNLKQDEFWQGIARDCMSFERQVGPPPGYKPPEPKP